MPQGKTEEPEWIPDRWRGIEGLALHLRGHLRWPNNVTFELEVNTEAIILMNPPDVCAPLMAVLSSAQ